MSTTIYHGKLIGLLPKLPGAAGPAMAPPQPSVSQSIPATWPPGPIGLPNPDGSWHQPVVSWKPLTPTPAKELARVVPALNEPALCPACQLGPGLYHLNAEEIPERSIADIVVELNDNHRWTREQIADWLDTLPYDLTIQPVSEGN